MDLKEKLCQKVDGIHSRKSLEQEAPFSFVVQSDREEPFLWKNGEEGKGAVAEPSVVTDKEEKEGYNNLPQMEVSIEEAKGRIRQLQEFIRYMMVPNIDYGYVPNCPKPMLFKAGAEKLCDI